MVFYSHKVMHQIDFFADEGSCKGTPAAVPTRANICVSTLNKGGSGDPGAQSAVGRPARIQAVSDIYIPGTTTDAIC
jgi:hypothetical protein